MPFCQYFPELTGENRRVLSPGRLTTMAIVINMRWCLVMKCSSIELQKSLTLVRARFAQQHGRPCNATTITSNNLRENLDGDSDALVYVKESSLGLD